MPKLTGFLAFFTEEYRKYSAPFTLAIDAIDKDVRIATYEVVTRGSYDANTNRKPWALEKVLEFAEFEHGDGIWVYSDIDCEWVAMPEPFPADDWDVGLVRNPNRTHKMRWGAQILAFNWTHPDNKYRILTFLRDWATRCDKQPGHTDHKFMLEAINNCWGSVLFRDFSAQFSNKQIVDGLDPSKEHKPS